MSLEFTAYHEAGHAVVATSLRVPLKSACVRDDCSGTVMLDGTANVGALNDLTLTIAGTLGERIVNPSKMLADDSKDAIDIRKALAKCDFRHAGSWKDHPILDLAGSIANRVLDRYRGEVRDFANLLLNKRSLTASEIACALWPMREQPAQSDEEKRLRARALSEVPSAKTIATAADAVYCLKGGIPVDYVKRDGIDLGHEGILFSRLNSARENIRIAATCAFAYGTRQPSPGFESAREFADHNVLAILRTANALSKSSLSKHELRRAMDGSR